MADTGRSDPTMRKTILLALVVLASLGALVGCGGKYHGSTIQPATLSQ